MPAFSDGYEAARTAIGERVEALLGELAPRVDDLSSSAGGKDPG